MTTATNLLVTCHHLARHIKNYEVKLREHNITLTTSTPTGQQFSSFEMSKLLADKHFAILGDDVIDEQTIMLAKSDKLRALIKWGIGTDSIDKMAAQVHGVPIFNTPNVFGGEVAEVAISYMLNLARSTHIIDTKVREGVWQKVEGESLTGKKIGILGLGSIGIAIAKRARAFDMDVFGCDPFQKLGDKETCFIKVVTLEKLFQTADFVVLACSLTPQTTHVANEHTLGLMKKNAYLINVSRGPLVDESALAKAISTQKIKGAGLDVFEIEPLNQSSSLLTLPNCIFGCHNASNTAGAVSRVNDMTIEMAIAGAENRLLSKFSERRVV